MSRKKVIVKRLNAIQNFGGMDVLCTDKTGTLTEDRVVLERHCDVSGRGIRGGVLDGYLISYFQTGLKNLLDRAILDHKQVSIANYKKLDEIPFDFTRRMMSVLVQDPARQSPPAHQRRSGSGVPSVLAFRARRQVVPDGPHPDRGV